MLSIPTRTSLTYLLASFVVMSMTVQVSVVDAQTSTVVVPNDRAIVEGDFENILPFGVSSTGYTGTRYQQVFGASDFGPPSGRQRITQIAFRPDGVHGQAFTVTIPSIQIHLSTTTRAPDGLGVFAENTGADDTVVFAGALAFSSAFAGPDGGPKAFDIVIDLQTPFIYDPTAGNLLLDVRVVSEARSPYFDAHGKVGDAVSRVYNFHVDDPNIDSADSFGLVARFTLSPIANVPQTIDDCKGGDWRTRTRADETTIKHQGHCIQYVRSGK